MTKFLDYIKNGDAATVLRGEAVKEIVGGQVRRLQEEFETVKMRVPRRTPHV